MTPAEIVRGFWKTMRGNDFAEAAHRWLTPDFIGIWPQSAEVIRGPAALAAINNAFPGGGHWRFEEISLVAEGDRVVTDIRVTNAEIEVVIHVITFHEIRGDQIARQVEYWPDAYPAPQWRRGLVEVDEKIARW